MKNIEKTLQIEFETKLNQTMLHIILPEAYVEDYQIPMLKYNQISGLLNVRGWEMEGRACYSYDVSNLVTMKTFYEKEPLQLEGMKHIVQNLLETVTELQNYMLSPDCIVLDPRYIFRKKERWFFAYLPGRENRFQFSFHELTEYFVKTLDYSDTAGIFLAYELHKATLEEHYDLTMIMEEYERHQAERYQEESQEIPESTEQGCCGNLFSLVEECEEEEETIEKNIYESTRDVLPIREEKKHYSGWKKAWKYFPRKNWGKWDDLILETDGHEQDTAL